MRSERLFAFVDAVIAVIITIMVLDLRPPARPDFRALAQTAPTFLSYVLSFVYVAIYWTNHHHFFALVKRVNGADLWANLHLVFWLSLIPFATAWLGAHPAGLAPTVVYGADLLATALAWRLMQTVIIHHQGADSALARAIGSDVKGRITPVIYLTGIALAFVTPIAADACYVLVALMWLIPDRRIERAVAASADPS
ncbi:MAG TPA: TMEM175 family protein [Caulobacteraceae bacterium]|jgi:uncharacterized membrane protein